MNPMIRRVLWLAFLQATKLRYTTIRRRRKKHSTLPKTTLTHYKEPSMSELWSLITFVWRHCRNSFVIAISLMGLTTAINYAHPTLLAKAVDLFSQNNVSAVSTLITWYLALIILGIALTPLERIYLTRLIHRTRRQVTIAWNKELLHKDYKHLQAFGRGKIATAFQRGADGLESILFDLMEYFLVSLMVVIITTSYIIYLGGLWILPLLVAVSWIIFSLQKKHLKSLDDLIKQNHQLADEKASYQGDLLSSPHQLRLARGVSSALKALERISKNYHKKNTHIEYRRARIYSLSDLAVSLTQAFLIIGSITLSQYTHITSLEAGEILGLYMYSSILISNLMVLPTMKTQLIQWLAEKKSLTEILQVKKDPPFLLSNSNPPKHRHPFELHLTPLPRRQNQNPTSSLLSLRESITIDFGTKVAIVGASGQGKSRFAEMICGLQQKEPIKITLGDQNTKVLPLAELTKKLFYAPSHTQTLSGTFWNTLTFGETFPQHLTENLLEKLELSHFASYLKEPKPFPTESLSSAEKKRLGLLRAMLLKRPITILDEPTEALNAELALKIWPEILDFFSYGTLICITHDLRYLKAFDQILTIQNHQVSQPT